MHKISRVFVLTIASALLFLNVQTARAQESDVANGQKLFDINCASCHQMGKKLIGPNLAGVENRWKNRDELKAFIKNSQAVIASGHGYAQQLYDQYKTVMPPQNLNDQEMEDVLAFIATGGVTTPNGAGADMAGVTPTAAPQAATGPSPAVLLLGILLLAGIAWALYLASNNLSSAARRRGVEGETAPVAKPGFGIWFAKVRRHANPTVVVLTIIMVLTLLFFSNLYNRAQDLGTQVGYAPEQPIKFNHKLHAGQYGIQCQYCHTGAEQGKSASIPSLSTCMNCHNYIQEGPQYGTDEINKIYKHVGWDAENRQYVEGAKQPPVEWIRIHNLPDHVYFNHSQHVVAGKLDCSNCHGAVQEMERVQQVSTLEMGWCINCHRESTVDNTNPYYTATFDFVKEHEKYTIGQLGGLNCSKCHY